MGQIIALALLAGPPPQSLLIDEAQARIDKGTRTAQLKGARLLLKAHEAGPQTFEGVVAASHAWFLRSVWAKTPQRREQAATRGVRYARRLIETWPKRAEGYYWAAVNLGMKARAMGITATISEGIPKQIESFALEALQRNRALYAGATQRLLGRFYYLLPWPLKKLERSIKLLEEAHEADPAHPSTQYYLAEALLEKDEADRRAVALLERCANGRRIGDPEAIPGCRRRLAALN